MTNFPAFDAIREQISHRTIGHSGWDKMSYPERCTLLKGVLTSIFIGNPPWYVVEADKDAPVVRVAECVVLKNGCIRLDTRLIPPESQRIIDFDLDPRLAQYWLTATGHSPSAYSDH